MNERQKEEESKEIGVEFSETILQGDVGFQKFSNSLFSEIKNFDMKFSVECFPWDLILYTVDLCPNEDEYNPTSTALPEVKFLANCIEIELRVRGNDRLEVFGKISKGIKDSHDILLETPAFKGAVNCDRKGFSENLNALSEKIRQTQ